MIECGDMHVGYLPTFCRRCIKIVSLGAVNDVIRAVYDGPEYSARTECTAIVTSP